ncbi:hypothetical protein C6A85_12980, partial [Mycobacterium sp. ITM-2017-0098]
LGPIRVLVTFPDGNAASAPAKEPLLEALRQKMTQAPNTVSVSRAPMSSGSTDSTADISALR